MRRRGKGSTKVPNVKLRPAQPGALSSRQDSLDSNDNGIWAQDSQLASDDTSMFDTCPRPFAGVVLCATRVTDKPGLFRQAVELGATTSSAFTDRVTHLIAIQHGGAKYMCALERKIPILQPSWITESYQIWLRGDDVVFSESLAKHRLPIFSDVAICPSGITDIVRRTEINKLVTANGGTYLKNLERPVRVTHLLCSGEEETEKMHYAEKFNKRGEADIKLVWEEWFWDSLDFGGRFDEDKYQVRRPRPEPRKSTLGAEQPSSPPPSSSLLSSNDSHPLPAAPKEKGKEKGSINTADENGNHEPEEPAAVTRLPAVQLQMWASLLKTRGYAVDEEGTGLIRSPGKTRPRNDIDDNTDDRDSGNRGRGEDEAEGQVRSSRSILSRSSFRRANSFAAGPSMRRVLSVKTKAPATTTMMDDRDGDGRTVEDAIVIDDDRVGVTEMEIDTPGAGPSTPRRHLDERSTPFGAEVEGGLDAAAADAPAQTTGPRPIFSGMRFTALGEADCPNVRDAIEKAGGVFVNGFTGKDKEGDVDVVVVRLASGNTLLSSRPPLASNSEDETWRTKFRTECWLERCLYEDRLCAKEEHVTFAPVEVECPIPGAEKIIISFSGLDEPEKLSMTRLMKVLGLKPIPGFSKRATHLLCPSAEGSKYEKALEWGTPVVGMSWVEELVRTGRVPGANAGTEAVLAAAAGGAAGGDGDTERRNVKGKGKEKKAGEDLNAKMADITNGKSQSQSQSRSGTQGESQDRAHAASAGARPPPQPISALPSLSKMTLSSDSSSFGKPTMLLQSKPKPQEQVNLPTDNNISTSPVRDISGPASESLEGEAEKIPSSTSPSPLKMPALNTDTRRKESESELPDLSSTSGSGVGTSANAKGKNKVNGQGKPIAKDKSSAIVSPSKYYPPVAPLDSEKAKELKESLTNLLGKRKSEERENRDKTEGTGGLGRGGDGGGGRERGGGKRSRINRVISQDVLPPPPPPVYDPANDTFDTGFGHAEHVNPLNPDLGKGQEEESMRVVYEDLEQRNERRKLMKLFESGPEDGTESVSVGVASGRGRGKGRKGKR